jgi:DNA/RNA endonuclease G (NUC1)
MHIALIFFKAMYGTRTKNEFDLLDNFSHNMQSYGMKNWVVWELLDSYISSMKKERMFEKDLYLQALERYAFKGYGGRKWVFFFCR